MSKNERTLTPAEQKRKADYEKLCEEMEQAGYQKRELTVGVVQANIIAVVIMLPFMAAIIAAYCVVHPSGIDRLSLGMTLLVFVLFCLLVVAHEGIHGLTWGLFTKNGFHSIAFGVIWSALTPYCTCCEPLSKRQYITGAVMPTLIVGFIPAAIAIACGQAWLLYVAVFTVLGGGGDFFIILKMLLYRPETQDVLYYDHPYECGVVAFEKMA